MAVAPSTASHPAKALDRTAETSSPGVPASSGRLSRSPYRQASALQEGTAKVRSRPDQPIRLDQAQAFQRLKAAGLRWKSSGGCTNRRVGSCTSLEAVRAATVANVIDLKRDSKCPIVVTGGTEVGHAPGRYSHHRGYKLDIKPNPCINDYITRNHAFAGIRSDGAPLYRNAGTVYAREPSHWDILFR
ncbi:hypothetical protein [Streptosporangium sp. NPDC087985]|uniref:hypothetical protein n=1 Tax=Streptosporangium sp. NPDC087985 TaxID=3366196 RepID=UPI0038279C73